MQVMLSVSQKDFLSGPTFMFWVVPQSLCILLRKPLFLVWEDSACC
jgi:hypothetical protein